MRSSNIFEGHMKVLQLSRVWPLSFSDTPTEIVPPAAQTLEKHLRGPALFHCNNGHCCIVWDHEHGAPEGEVYREDSYGKPERLSRFVQQQDLANVTAVSCASLHVVYQTQSGKLFSSKIHYGDTVIKELCLPPGVSVHSFSAGVYHATALGSDRKLYAWVIEDVSDGHAAVGPFTAIPKDTAAGIPAGPSTAPLLNSSATATAVEEAATAVLPSPELLAPLVLASPPWQHNSNDQHRGVRSSDSKGSGVMGGSGSSGSNSSGTAAATEQAAAPAQGGGASTSSVDTKAAAAGACFAVQSHARGSVGGEAGAGGSIDTTLQNSGNAGEIAAFCSGSYHTLVVTTSGEVYVGARKLFERFSRNMGMSNTRAKCFERVELPRSEVQQQQQQQQEQQQQQQQQAPGAAPLAASREPRLTEVLEFKAEPPYSKEGQPLQQQQQQATSAASLVGLVPVLTSLDLSSSSRSSLAAPGLLRPLGGRVLSGMAPEPAAGVLMDSGYANDLRVAIAAGPNDSCVVAFSRRGCVGRRGGSGSGGNSGGCSGGGVSSSIVSGCCSGSTSGGVGGGSGSGLGNGNGNVDGADGGSGGGLPITGVFCWSDDVVSSTFSDYGWSRKYTPQPRRIHELDSLEVLDLSISTSMQAAALTADGRIYTWFIHKANVSQQNAVMGATLALRSAGCVGIGWVGPDLFVCMDAGGWVKAVPQSG